MDDPLLLLPGYMPPEHLAAVYAPVIAPLVVPFLYSLFDEYRRYSRLVAEANEVLARAKDD